MPIKQVIKPTKDNPFCHTNVLAKEVKVFEKNLDSFMQDHAGEFVLIKGENVDGFFKDEDEALKIGTSRYWRTGSFLVRKVARKREPARLPALTLGLITAKN